MANITQAQADAVVAAATRLAADRGATVAAAVVDAGGNLVAFSRMDGATLITIDTAVGKAFTAVSVGADTVNLPGAIAPGAPLFGTGLTLAGLRSFVPYPGGVLVRGADGTVVGAVGVSGAADSAVDHEVGEAAAQGLGLGE